MVYFTVRVSFFILHFCNTIENERIYAPASRFCFFIKSRQERYAISILSQRGERIRKALKRNVRVLTTVASKSNT